MAIRLYDSATREVRDFTPLTPGKASIYVCGLTVQSEPHVGHVRSAVNFDVLRRWLEFRGHEVTFIRNVTDIDDKILAKAEAAGRPWYAHAQLMHDELARAYAALNVQRPTYEPLATGHVPEMLALIEELIAAGHAYVAEDGVYFDVRSWPAYGELTNQGLGTGWIDTVQAAEDGDAKDKRDPRDFALWKNRKPSEPETASWPSPWGPGRPGWHIECSAMAGKYLGPAFDIHGGGLDLRFPHHENELAQSRAAGRPFANLWMHNAWITTAGEKMSKSLGNSLTIPNVLERYRGIELRYYLVAAHYRSAVEFSFEALDEAAAAFRRIEGFLERAATGSPAESVEAALPQAFVDALDDDLGTPSAVAVVHETVREGNKASDPTPYAAQVEAMLDVLGLNPVDPAWASTGGTDDILPKVVGIVIDQRNAARAAKDFVLSDALRDSLAEAGISIKDGPDGTEWSLD